MARTAKKARYEPVQETDDEAYAAAMGGYDGAGEPDPSEPGVEPAHYEYADSMNGANGYQGDVHHDDLPVTQADPVYPDDGIDYSDCFKDDDGYNEFRRKVPHEQLVDTDIQDLAEYMYYVMSEKKKLTEAFEERKKMMQRQVDAIEKAIRQKMVSRKTPKQSFTFNSVDGYPVSVSVEPKHEDHFKVEDWEALYGWIADNSAYDVLQKRVSERTMQDYMEQLATLAGTGEITADQAVVPGVSKVSVPVLGVTARKVTPKTK